MCNPIVSSCTLCISQWVGRILSFSSAKGKKSVILLSKNVLREKAWVVRMEIIGKRVGASRGKKGRRFLKKTQRRAIRGRGTVKQEQMC